MKAYTRFGIYAAAIHSSGSSARISGNQQIDNYK